jgi:hypothetical protein
LKTKKNGKKRGKTKQIFRTNIIKEKKIPLAFKKQKIGKIGQKTQIFFLFLKGKKQRKTKQ